MPDFSVMLPVFYLPSEDRQTGTTLFSRAPGDLAKQTDVINEILIYMAEWVFNGIWKTSIPF